MAHTEVSVKASQTTDLSYTLRGEDQRLDRAESDFGAVPNLIEDAHANQLGAVNVIDAYRDGDLGVHVRIRVDVGQPEPHDYVAVFKALMRDDLHVRRLGELPVHEHVVDIFGREDCGRMQDAMAVLPRKLVEHPES